MNLEQFTKEQEIGEKDLIEIFRAEDESGKKLMVKEYPDLRVEFVGILFAQEAYRQIRTKTKVRDALEFLNNCNYQCAEEILRDMLGMQIKEYNVIRSSKNGEPFIDDQKKQPKPYWPDDLPY